MKLSYRGTSYEFMPAVELPANGATGKYRGIPVCFATSIKPPMLENVQLSYRGINYH